jgi:ribosomal protein S25
MYLFVSCLVVTQATQRMEEQQQYQCKKQNKKRMKERVNHISILNELMKRSVMNEHTTIENHVAIAKELMSTRM